MYIIICVYLKKGKKEENNLDLATLVSSFIKYNYMQIICQYMT